uniref:Vacuolar protein sorting-associated protein 35 n=1 Tax=Salix viminalis TaxID=40686 RepID=A0A6N2KPL5_SALVM
MILTGIEDEDKWLAEGIASIQHNAFYMHRALEANNLRDALKCSALMLSELRTSKLSPHKYYDLYMRAFDELRKLEMFFKDESKHGVSIVDLYELVQHAGNILPRLYLLCTVGSVYIKSKEAPAKDVLKDLCSTPNPRIVLRSYLAQVSRDKLLDLGSEYEGAEDTVMVAVEFVLQNFTEMNKLWVRMQHQGPVRVKEKMEKERSELCDLVGKNLHVLSQIEGVNLEIYRDTVLPRVLEQVVNCKDELAQYYLLDCIIQVFPDEYHLQTLETLLGACPQLQPTVDVKTVLSRLMARLSNYAASSADALPEFLQVEAFAKLSIEIIETQVDMHIVGAVALYVSLLSFTLQYRLIRDKYGACVKSSLENQNLKTSEQKNKCCTSECSIRKSAMKNKTCISTADKVKYSLHIQISYIILANRLIKDLDETAKDEVHVESFSLDEEDFKEEQNSVARLIHMLYNDDSEEMLKL